MYNYGPVCLEVNISVERIWAAMKDLKHILPKIMPIMRVAVDIEGDGGPGSIRIIKFPSGVSTKVFSIDRIDVLDDATYTEKHTLIGGEAEKPYAFYRTTMTFRAIDKMSTIVSWSVEYEPLDAFVVPEATKGMYIAAFKAMEAYLLCHDDYTFA
ncbi:unnamed protein product [Calypogeia fissa]